MAIEKIFEEIKENLDTVLKQDSILGKDLWQELIKLHPADIAEFLGDLSKATAQEIFKKLPKSLKLAVFKYISDSLKVFALSSVYDQDRAYLLSSLPIDELTDFFDELSDEELKKYIKLLHKGDREKVLSLMQFDPETAGGIMDTDIMTLRQDLTVEKAIQIIQRIQPRKELRRVIYVTNVENELIGYIKLEHLVLKEPKTRINSFVKKPVYVAHVNEDQEEVAQKMLHYKLTIVPVIDSNNIFLGAIPSDVLIDVIEQEAAEDVYRISALKPIKQSYFDTPFFTLFYQRASILTVLLLMQTFSSIIIQHYEALLEDFLMFFITMLTSTGGNTSSQTSAIVIQGLTSGEIRLYEMGRFLWREFKMSIAIAFALGCISFIRIYFTHSGNIMGNIAVSLSLSVIVLISIMLGSLIPLILKKLKLDPALSAGPFLATLMDILGLLVYCYISKLILT